MEVIFVEYFSQYDLWPDWKVVVYNIGIIIGIILGVILLGGFIFSILCKHMNHILHFLALGMSLLIIGISCLIDCSKQSAEVTDYISKALVRIEDDTVSLDLFKDWEITEEKGNDIYVIKPKSGVLKKEIKF